MNNYHTSKLKETKIKIEFHKQLKKSPFRVRADNANVYVSTLDEAKRIKRFVLKLLEVNNVEH